MFRVVTDVLLFDYRQARTDAMRMLDNPERRAEFVEFCKNEYVCILCVVTDSVC